MCHQSLLLYSTPAVILFGPLQYPPIVFSSFHPYSLVFNHISTYKLEWFLLSMYQLTSFSCLKSINVPINDVQVSKNKIYILTKASMAFAHFSNTIFQYSLSYMQILLNKLWILYFFLRLAPFWHLGLSVNSFSTETSFMNTC